jgi:ATPase subunit of ABC transporter with duplicated ATPase domains
MMHNPIHLRQLSLSFAHKTCFADFNATIAYGDHIAIIGRNGAGKSTLLNMLRGAVEPTDGTIDMPSNAHISYVPQVPDDVAQLSGGQLFNAALTKALAAQPNILLLDEPTNHLDYKNRQSLMRNLQNFPGTLIMVTHDRELLQTCADSFWHINHEKITLFNGSYDAYLEQQSIKKTQLDRQLALLERNKKTAHDDLMREQERSKKSKLSGQKRYAGDTLTLRAMQARGQASTNKRRQNIQEDKQEILNKLSQLYVHESIEPKFSITAADVGTKHIVSIAQGSCGYQKPVVQNINLTVGPRERVALLGDNGSGKSTVLKAIMHDPSITITGSWHAPKHEQIGYLDQQYSTLEPHATPVELMQQLVPSWSLADIRKHLNNFLFRKNEEVMAPVTTLSGGERARLSLALIGAKTPQLLLLDEITNNIDLETREHVIEVLRAYPGALIAISHDTDFLRELGIESYYTINDGQLMLV